MSERGVSPRPLSEWNPFDPALSADPYEYYALLRREAPVYRDPNTGIFQVASYQHVCEALKNHEVFSNKFGIAMAKNAAAPDPDLLAIQKKSWPPVDTMLTADPPEQTRFRSLVNKAFTPRRATRLESAIEALCDELIDGFVEDGRVEARNIRRDILEQLRAMEKDKEVSQDEGKRAQEQLQKMTDLYIGQMDGLGVEKEKEVMEV